MKLRRKNPDLGGSYDVLLDKKPMLEKIKMSVPQNNLRLQFLLIYTNFCNIFYYKPIKKCKGIYPHWPKLKIHHRWSKNCRTSQTKRKCAQEQVESWEKKKKSTIKTRLASTSTFQGKLNGKVKSTGRQVRQNIEATSIHLVWHTKEQRNERHYHWRESSLPSWKL